MSVISAWSFSRYELYALCPLAFKLKNIDKVPEPTSPAMQRGRDVHKALENYLRGEQNLPPEVKHPFHVKLYGEMRALPADNKVFEQQWGFAQNWKPTGWFDRAGKPKTWFRAILDFGTLYDDNTFDAVDHKTGKKYGENAEQMELFAFAVMCKYPVVTDVTTRLEYLDSGDEEIAEFPVSDRALLQAKWEAKVAPMFTDTVFAPRPNDKCRFCHFRKSNGLNFCKFG